SFGWVRDLLCAEVVRDRWFHLVVSGTGVLGFLGRSGFGFRGAGWLWLLLEGCGAGCPGRAFRRGASAVARRGRVGRCGPTLRASAGVRHRTRSALLPARRSECGATETRCQRGRGGGVNRPARWSAPAMCAHP